MLSSNEVLKFLEQNRERIESFGADRIGVFEPVSRDESKEGSDVDVLVILEMGRSPTETSSTLGVSLRKSWRWRSIWPHEALKPSIRDQVIEEVKYGKEA
ncbi:MAG: nucleotidyltransferase family protein [Candidatus Nanohaloarchaea archaeon]